MIIQEIQNLLEESVDLSEFDILTEDLIELGLTLDDLDSIEIEEIIGTAGAAMLASKIGAAGAAAAGKAAGIGGAGAIGAIGGTKAGLIAGAGGIASKTGAGIAGSGMAASAGGYTTISGGLIASNGVLLGIPLAIFAAVAGGMLIYRYLNSIGRLTKVVAAYKQKISQTSDPKTKKKLSDKMNVYQLKLEKAQAAARVKKAKFIQDTKDMNDSLNKLKAEKGDPAKIKKLTDQLQKRNKIMAKLGLIK